MSKLPSHRRLPTSMDQFFNFTRKYRPLWVQTVHHYNKSHFVFLNIKLPPLSHVSLKSGLLQHPGFIFGAEQRLLYSSGTLRGARRLQAAPALEATQLAWARTLNLWIGEPSRRCGPGSFQVADHCRSNSWETAGPRWNASLLGSHSPLGRRRAKRKGKRPPSVGENG